MGWWNGNHQPSTSPPVKLMSNISRSTNKLVSWNSDHGHMMVFRLATLKLKMNGFLNGFLIQCTSILYLHVFIIVTSTLFQSSLSVSLWLHCVLPKYTLDTTFVQHNIFRGISHHPDMNVCMCVILCSVRQHHKQRPPRVLFLLARAKGGWGRHSPEAQQRISSPTSAQSLFTWSSGSMVVGELGAEH